MQNIHDPAILQPGSIVEEAAQLLRESRHGALGVLSGFKPVVVNATGAGIGACLGDGRLGEHPLDQPGQLLLPVSRHQELPECVEAPALIGIRNCVAVAHDVLEQRSLGPLPERDALPHPPIEHPEVVLHLPEIAKELACDLHELLETVLQRRVVEQREVAGLRALDLGVERGAALSKLRNSHLRVGFRALVHLPQQLEQGPQARLRPDEAAFRERGEPGDCLLGCRGEVELGLVGVLAVELAQPPLLRTRPVVEIVQGGSREHVGTQAFAQGVQLVFQRLGQIALRQHPLVRRDEHSIQKARRQRRVIGAQQPPGGMALAKPIERVVVEIHGATRRRTTFGGHPTNPRDGPVHGAERTGGGCSAAAAKVTMNGQDGLGKRPRGTGEGMRCARRAHVLHRSDARRSASTSPAPTPRSQVTGTNRREPTE